jgi:hypothetical protein
LSKFIFNIYFVSFSLTRIFIVLLITSALFAKSADAMGFPALAFLKGLLATIILVGSVIIVLAVKTKCPSCGKRPLINRGNDVELRVATPSKLRYFSWFIPGELFVKYFYCCRCHEKIECTD